MDYRYEATSVEGFVQQLACNYLPHGYFFYVTGFIPTNKDPRQVDRKLLAKYGIAISRQSRARRKQAGFANLHYLRYRRFFVLLATHGRHLFFAEEAKRLRDARRAPIRFKDYAISVKRHESGVEGKCRVSVQIARERYLGLKAYFLSFAIRRSGELLYWQLYALPYVPYARVRQQLLNILRVINKARRAAGYARVGTDAIRYRRHIVKPFERPRVVMGPHASNDAFRITEVEEA